MSNDTFNPTVSFWVHPAKQFKDRIYWETDTTTGNAKAKAIAPRTYEKAIEEGKSYATLEHRKLKEIILSLSKITYPVKGAEGSMFFFLDDTNVYHNKEDMLSRGTYKSIGICGIDLDDMPEELAELVNSHFHSYVERMPQLVASYISNSKHGIHIVVRCSEGLDNNQYVLQTIMQTLRLVDVIREVDGVDLYQYIDVSSTSMSQRHFTAHCDNPQWNDCAVDSYIEIPSECPAVGDEATTKRIKDRWKRATRNKVDPDELIREFMPELFENEDTYELDKITAPIDPTLYVDYEHRWLIWISLFKLLKGNKQRFQEEVTKIAEQFSRNSGSKGHPVSYFTSEAARSLKESKKAYAFPYGLLAKLGYSTKHSEIVRIEKKVEEAKAEEEDKRRVMVEARKHWISRIQASSSKIKLQGRYISDTEIPIIENAIKENQRVTLKAPTGTGKTTAIKRIANEHNAIVLAPFKVLVQEYASDLKVINDEKEYKSSSACCMTYDRFVIMGMHHFQNKWIFIDEAHVLFMHRTYREKLVELFKKIDLLIAHGCRIIFVSATPIFTEGTKLIELYQDRPMVRVFPVFLKCKDGKHGRRAENFIKKRILDNGGLDEAYDRIVIFSDNSSRRLYDSTVFVQRDKVGIMHSDYPEECAKITTDKKLKAKKTMCTSIAYNGVNFTNEDEYIAVISMVEDSTTAWNIIQQCGRVRNSIVDLYVVCDRDSESEKLTVDQRVKLNDLRNELGLNGKVLWTDQIEADKQVEQYINANSDITKILTDLINEDYFFVRGQMYIELDAEPKENPLRRAVDRYVKDNLCKELLDSTLVPEFDKEIMTKYFRENINAINSLIDGQYLLSVSEMADLLKYTGSKSIKSVVSELKQIKTAVSYNDADINEMELKYKRMTVEYNGDKIILKQLRSQLNEIEKLHDTYKNCITDSDIIKTYKNKQKENRSKQLDGRSKGGKNKGLKITISQNGYSESFNSKKDAAERLGCSRPTLDSAIKNGKKVNGFTISKIG